MRVRSRLRSLRALLRPARSRPTPKRLAPPDVAILVLNWNNRECTLDCLASLEGADLGGATVLLVDNASTDGSVEAARARFPGLRLLALPGNRGYAGGNNAGIADAVARGAGAVLILNND